MLPREIPQEGKAGRRNWTNLKLRKPPSVVAWITGSAVWVDTHYVTFESRPCRDCLTKGKLKCMIDHGRYPLRKLGYLPLVIRGGQDVFAVVQEGSAAELAAIKPGAQVTVMREPGRGKPIVVVPALAPERYPGINDHWAEPVQFDACLFRLWGDSELALFFGVRGVKHRAVFRDAIPLDNDEQSERSGSAQEIAPQGHRDNASLPSPAVSAALDRSGLLGRSVNGTH